MKVLNPLRSHETEQFLEVSGGDEGPVGVGDGEGVIAGVGDDPARNHEDPRPHRDPGGVEEGGPGVQQAVDIVEPRRVEIINRITEHKDNRFGTLFEMSCNVLIQI